MKLKIRVDDEETRAVWETVLKAKAEVESWPAWKRGERPVRPALTTPPAGAPATERSEG
jgi:hypothetical protein